MINPMALYIIIIYIQFSMGITQKMKIAENNLILRFRCFTQNGITLMRKKFVLDLSSHLNKMYEICIFTKYIDNIFARYCIIHFTYLYLI